MRRYRVYLYAVERTLTAGLVKFGVSYAQTQVWIEANDLLPSVEPYLIRYA